jgi:hypothetical protein
VHDPTDSAGADQRPGQRLLPVLGRLKDRAPGVGVLGFRMCDGKVRFTSDAAALAKASLQEAQHGHFAWSFYDCLWCDFLHIGRHGVRPGHGDDCRNSCQREARQQRELRILEGTW